MGVVLFQLLRRELDHFGGSQCETSLLESGKHLTDKVFGHAVRFEDDKRLIHTFGKSTVRPSELEA